MEARQHGFRLIEWTLDRDRLYDNPLLTVEGQAEIRALCREHGVSVLSLTGDCFMHAPFWKAPHEESTALKQDFQAVAEACAKVGIVTIVLPLVDNGRLDNAEQEDALVDFLQSKAAFLADHALCVTLESDFGPAELGRFIARLDSIHFGVNYDIGNSAALGFDPIEEIAVYGHRILNVHVKDRVRDGMTVPLGAGDADFGAVFTALRSVGYSGNFILQTARANDGDHVGVLCSYRDRTVDWLARHAV